MKNKDKRILSALTAIGTLLCIQNMHAQVLSFDPELPNTIIPKDSPASRLSSKAASPSSLPSLASYAGTYVGVVVYYNIDNGVGDWEVIFRKNGTIGLSEAYQNKYPQANVSGRFERDGTFSYTNRTTGGLTFVTTGKINLKLEKLSARFTSSSAGTGTIVCHKLITK